MSRNPNYIKSQDDLNTCNDGKRSSDVLVATIEKCEKLEEENKTLKDKNKQLKKELMTMRDILNFVKELSKKYAPTYVKKFNEVISNLDEMIVD